MKKILSLLAVTFLLTVNTFAQGIDSLKLTDKEIPAGYSVSKENTFISIQASIFYKNPVMYEVIIGKLKTKDIQSFENGSDKGSILYFEFEGGYKGKGFLEGLLWGGKAPTDEHPEEIFSKGNVLVIWSFKKDSKIKQVSMDKVKSMLK